MKFFDQLRRSHLASSPPRWRCWLPPFLVRSGRYRIDLSVACELWVRIAVIVVLFTVNGCRVAGLARLAKASQRSYRKRSLSMNKAAALRRARPTLFSGILIQPVAKTGTTENGPVIWRQRSFSRSRSRTFAPHSQPSSVVQHQQANRCHPQGIALMRYHHVCVYQSLTKF